MIIEIGYILNPIKVRDVNTTKADGTQKTTKCMNNRISFLTSGGRVSYATITAWGHVAERFLNFSEGDLIYIEGYLITKKRKLGEREIEEQYIEIQTVKATGKSGKKEQQKEEIPAEEPQENTEENSEEIISDESIPDNF